MLFACNAHTFTSRVRAALDGRLDRRLVGPSALRQAADEHDGYGAGDGEDHGPRQEAPPGTSQCPTLVERQDRTALLLMNINSGAISIVTDTARAAPLHTSV